jgi:hypothetical protein
MDTQFLITLSATKSGNTLKLILNGGHYSAYHCLKCILDEGQRRLRFYAEKYQKSGFQSGDASSQCQRR